ncbi:carbohydrate binding domain-containing protein [Paenibacillus oceani]|uniref:Carbohydrate binding domain-containing protein n=1 Tax=Paenibacillus oceani TaxID=2772510 RepID=A0A927CC92_9BACL|nr:carbohydrate binding domain-containing protein [Paenibacillus oceani]MBD2864102.1 carbohydrate binding domain-containing protein [Paenibacillus oceani]
MIFAIEVNGEERNGPVVPASVLGTNLEVGKFTDGLLLSDRLDNPKFFGPEGADGLAPGWQPRGNHYAGVQYRLVPGLGMNGGDAQTILVYAGRASGAMLQTGRRVKAGERLVAEVWAMAKHQPFGLELSLRPLPVRDPDYGTARVTVDTAYWKKYTAEFECPADDPEAVFVVSVDGPGFACFDQIHLRPAGQPAVHAELMETIESMRLPVLRFPGGCTSTAYHWRLGTGPAHLRPVCHDPVNKSRLEYEFGTGEYLDMCVAQGIQPFITVNIGTGTPEEAGEWAGYCKDWYSRRGMELPDLYFQMGNEQYGRWELSHMDASMYVRALRDFVPRVREGYPKAVIVALGEPTSVGVWQPDSGWRETLLKDGRDLFDVVSINRYKGQKFADPQRQLDNAADSVEKITDDLRTLIRDCREAGSQAKVALTEWNYWMSASHWDGRGFYEPDDVSHGLFYSGMIHALARLAPDLAVANYYHLLNVMGMIRCDHGDVSATSIAALYRLYRPVFPGECLPLSVKPLAQAGEGGGREGGGVLDGDASRAEVRLVSVSVESQGESASAAEEGAGRQLDAFAMRSGGSVWLFVSNRSVIRPAQAAIRMDSSRWRSAVLMTAANERSSLTESMAQTATETIELPPLSLIRIEYEG